MIFNGEDGGDNDFDDDGDGEDVVNCPTRWSLSLLFVWQRNIVQQCASEDGSDDDFDDNGDGEDGGDDDFDDNDDEDDFTLTLPSLQDLPK